MAQLTLQSLQASNSFAGAPVHQEIEWENTEGELQKADVWVRRGSYATMTQTWALAAENKDHLASQIATLICDQDGGPVFTAADVLGTADPSRGPICDRLFMALLDAMNKVNAGKKSPQRTSGSN